MPRRQTLHPYTAIINKAQKTKSQQEKQQALKWLSQSFPAAFDTNQCIRPLKIGILQDILHYVETDKSCTLSKSKLREALVIFTRSIDYLACLKAQEMRIDLQGNPIALVTAEEAQNAGDKIRKKIERSIRLNRQQATNPNKEQASSYLVEKEENTQPTYGIEKTSAFTNQQWVSAANNTASNVVIKHKTSKQYDPSAVARLKEKLG